MKPVGFQPAKGRQAKCEAAGVKEEGGIGRAEAGTRDGSPVSNSQMPESCECAAINHHTAFYNDAERYDLVAGALSGDGPVEFYRTRALLYGAPVLELAAGTGRLAIPIAQQGIKIVGLDISPEMLSTADRKAQASDVSITWVHADMRCFELAERFHFIFAASNSFSHMYTRDDIESCLACVRHHLNRSGRFIVDVFNPALALFSRPPHHRSSVATYIEHRSGAPVSVWKSVRYDSATQISHETWYFRNDISGREETVRLNLRMFFPQEIDAVLNYNGFTVEQKYGDHQEGPFDDSSRKQIIVCAAA
jgi:ubiquinone/menaquinone biosynthesis C-methylase UbiE